MPTEWGDDESSSPNEIDYEELRRQLMSSAGSGAPPVSGAPASPVSQPAPATMASSGPQSASVATLSHDLHSQLKCGCLKSTLLRERGGSWRPHPKRRATLHSRHPSVQSSLAKVAETANRCYQDQPASLGSSTAWE